MKQLYGEGEAGRVGGEKQKENISESFSVCISRWGVGGKCACTHT